MSTAKVFVGSLPPGCKPDELRRLFSKYGAVVECDVMNRCGFVHLENTDMADAAIAALNGVEFKGQNIVVEPGRPKERGRKVGVGGGPGAGNRGGRRPMQQAHSHGGESCNGPSVSGSTHRGGQNNFRRVASGGGRAGDSRDSISNGSNFGPIRNDRNYNQQRNAPYSKGPQQQQTHHSEGSGQGFKNRFNTSGSGGANRFGGSGSVGGSFNNSPGNRFGGQNQQFQQWDNMAGSHSNANNVQSGRRNFKNSPSSGLSGNNQHNDFQGGHPSSSGGGGGSNGGMGIQRGGGLGATNVRQDRRGFTLAAVDHQRQQQPVSFGGSQQGRFGNGQGPIRSDNPVINSGNHQGGRAGFNASRGNFGGRGGYNARPSNNDREMSQNQGSGGGFNKRGGPLHSQNQNSLTAYQTEFPPLGPNHCQSGGGQRNRFNSPRQGPGPNMGGNRRF